MTHPRPPIWYSLLIVTLTLAACIAHCVNCVNCVNTEQTHQPEDSCGGKGSHPVTIGGSMVIGCR